jgi:hypothetical protein
MDKWASGKYSEDVAFVCVSLGGPELASTFVKELKLTTTTVTYSSEDPAWGQLGCGGFIVLDGDGRVASAKTAAYLDVRERAFREVESLLDSLLDWKGCQGARCRGGTKLPAPPEPSASPPPSPPPPSPSLGSCGTASLAPKDAPRLEERAMGTCAARIPRSEGRGGGDHEPVVSFSAPIQSVSIAALDAEHAACTAALQQLASTHSFAALEQVLRAYEAHFSHEETLLDTYLWQEAAATAAAGGAAGGGFDKNASMRSSHFADHARMLRELAPSHVEREEATGGDAPRKEEGELPRAIVERALRDFEAHANRYDSYGDELGAALRRAGAAPAAALAAAGSSEGTGGHA